MIDNMLPVASVNGLNDNNFVLAGDFDGDKFSDVLYFNKQIGSNRIVVNRGDGRFDSFDNRIPSALINGLYDNNYVLAGDFDGNGISDLLYTNKQTGANRLVLNRGNFQFDSFDNRVPPGLINGLYDNHFVLAGDFDGNGLSDVLYVHKQTGENRLIVNRGNFRFDNFDNRLPRGAINGLYDNHSVLAGDFDGNGLSDFLYVHKQTGENRIVLNNGDFRFDLRDGAISKGSINGLGNESVLVAGSFDRFVDSELLSIRKSNGENRLFGYGFGLKDEGLNRLMSTIYVGGISREEMIKVLRSAGNDGVVSKAELTDLRLIVTPNCGFWMPDSVRNLASDVVNSNPANARFQGLALGNLVAGSSSKHLTSLVEKWFFGADTPKLPTGGTAYVDAIGTLFNGAPTRFDAGQGIIGDCYFVAALQGIADSSPNAVRNMFVDNGDGTFTVRFYTSGGSADYVTVNRRLPVYPGLSYIANRYVNNSFAAVGFATSATDGNAILWLPLLEKAYAQWNETGNAGRDGTNSYAGLEWGTTSDANRQVLGYGSADFLLTTERHLANSLGRGRAVTIATRSVVSSGITAQHAYVVANYNALTGIFTLHNPHANSNPINLSWGQLVENCINYTVTNTSTTSPPPSAE